MTLSFSQQLKGYWLGFFAWLILTFAPIATSFAQSDEGFLRLCTAKGAQWVQLIGSEANKSQSACVCLSAVISPDTLDYNSPEASISATSLIQASRFSQPSFHRYHSRAPPFVS
ncbi:hypothetical protein QWZ13_01095 [Reinekea marina]|uniref:Uncharacterized protein n=1 Tax=Reinekea marina TaxID=1310421 RepID=A0ABV7WXF7_9GAMM|nr:hypothetical protein [Reinekea marina]MDN3647498.1 hypothetical protein [Reinekea marina]